MEKVQTLQNLFLIYSTTKYNDQWAPYKLSIYRALELKVLSSTKQVNIDQGHIMVPIEAAQRPDITRCGKSSVPSVSV